MGIPAVMPFKESMKSVSDVADNYMRGFEIYNKTFALWMDLSKKNVELLNNTMIELQKATTQTYKGLMPPFSVSDDERTKIHDLISESIKKNVETTTSMMRARYKTSQSSTNWFKDLRFKTGLFFLFCIFQFTFCIYKFEFYP